MDLNQRFSVIIPAAGIGSRMEANIPKQYLRINGLTILEHTVNTFLSHPLIDQVVIALHKNDEVFSQLEIASHPKIRKVIGGEQRVDSVLSALHVLCETHQTKDEQAYVLVHDAARPCLTVDELENLIKSCIALNMQGFDGAILATPVVDTLKKATIEYEKVSVDCTVDRTFLWQAQTPQMFKLPQLKEAIMRAKKANVAITDEASAMEFAGHKVALVEGMTSNIKITRPSDLSLANFYLSQSSS